MSALRKRVVTIWSMSCVVYLFVICYNGANIVHIYIAIHTLIGNYLIVLLAIVWLCYCNLVLLCYCNCRYCVHCKIVLLCYCNCVIVLLQLLIVLLQIVDWRYCNLLYCIIAIVALYCLCCAIVGGVAS